LKAPQHEAFKITFQVVGKQVRLFERAGFICMLKQPDLWRITPNTRMTAVIKSIKCRIGTRAYGKKMLMVPGSSSPLVGAIAVSVFIFN